MTDKAGRPTWYDPNYVVFYEAAISRGWTPSIPFGEVESFTGPGVLMVSFFRDGVEVSVGLKSNLTFQRAVRIEDAARQEGDALRVRKWLRSAPLNFR